MAGNLRWRSGWQEVLDHKADRGALAGSAWFCVWRRTEMFSVKQAAERLGISAKLVYSLCAGGKIVHERHGLGRGTIRITEEALEEYRRGCTVGTRAKEIPTVRRMK